MTDLMRSLTRKSYTDPRVKGDLILQELEDKEAGNLILKDIHDKLLFEYAWACGAE
jgi:hypothetical protein